MLKLKHALLASLCLLPLTATETIAATAGVTAAVNQNAKSIPPGGAVRTVVLGANVVQDETIETDGGGLVQILLADGTTFTVGPNSSITIDRFVYDPNANTAQVSATIGRGVFRFIGGRTSKTEGGVQLNTPVGTVGIRGGMADLNFTGAGQIDLLFGNEVTLDGPNGSDRIFQPGYSIVFGSNGQPTVIKTPPGSANFIQQALAGRPGQSGGSSQKPDDGKVADSGVPGSNSDGSLPNPQNIPQPDLRAIELATPKPNDNHQVAENVNPHLPTPGKRGFSSGVFYFDAQTNVIGAPAHDLDGDTRIRFDSNGNPIGGIVVVGMETAEDYEGTIYEVKASVRVGDYPGSGQLSMTYDNLELGTLTSLQTTITASEDLDTEDWPDTDLVSCDCVSWGTWEATFGDFESFENAGLKGTWITGDIIE
ncbi:MAG TPA: FecR domain-containing protein, partial [Devosia sp.]